MGIAELFAVEWQSLQTIRQQLVEQTGELRRKLLNLTEEPAMQLLLLEKTQLRGTVRELQNEVAGTEALIDSNLNFLKKRKQAESDRKIAKELADWLEKRKKVLQEFLELDAPSDWQETQRRMIWEIEGSLGEVEQYYLQKNVAAEQKKQEVQHTLQEVLARIGEIEEHYRQTKKCLEDAIRSTEHRRQQLHEECLQWASQNRDHLQWILKVEPLYRDAVLSRYRARFPEDNISYLLPTPTATRVCVPNIPKRRRKQKTSPEVSTTVTEPVRPWRFVVTFNVHELGQELPFERQQFLGALKSALQKANYHSLSVELVYDKLLAVAQMTTQQRQEMNRIIGDEPQGWKILRLGKRHRLFLVIEEEGHVIRFLPSPRNKSYKTH